MLSYQTYGIKRDIPLVILHGFLCSGEFFKPNIQSLKKSHFILTIDLPGFGDSHQYSPVNSIQQMAEQVWKTLTELGIKRINLLGHSMGGMVALNMATMEPQRVNKLIPYATNCHGKLPERFESFEESAQRLQQDDFEQTKGAICSTWFKQGSHDNNYKYFEDSSRVVSLKTALLALQAMSEFDLNHQLKNISCPTKIIAAELDKTYALHHLQEMNKRLENSSITIMQNCSHNAHLEDSETFNRIIESFLFLR